MGTQDVRSCHTTESRTAFFRAVLDDLRALERMLDTVAFDDDIRIGAEQEYVLLDQHLNPAPAIEDVLAKLSDDRFTIELGRFNLEANLSPVRFGGRCLSALRAELEELTAMARAACRQVGAELLITGILPNFELVHARLENMTRLPRFAEFNRRSLASRGGRLPLAIQGRDALTLWHDNIMLEAGPTSFQVHLQVTPERFARAFNMSLLLAAPLVSVAANAALLGGNRLWHETRIPLLERSADLRTPAQSHRGGRSRTSLGAGFVKESIVELYREDLAYFDTILTPPSGESSLEVLERGELPKLSALAVFNGTVWRWIRPCFGITEGKPHLRIENRVISAGPTIADEMANAAFWLGLMQVLPERYPDLDSLIAFEDVDANFHAAARSGLDAELLWIDGERVNAADLIEEQLLPLAREGLVEAGISRRDADEALLNIRRRVQTRQTGAQWMLDAFESLPRELPRRERAWRVTSALVDLCEDGKPVSRWSTRLPEPKAEPSICVALRSEFTTMAPDVPADVARYVLEANPDDAIVVEDADGTFRGLVALEDVRDAEGATLGELADAGCPSLTATTSIRAALSVFANAACECGVVLRRGSVVGLVYVRDLLRAAHRDVSRSVLAEGLA